MILTFPIERIKPVGDAENAQGVVIEWPIRPFIARDSLEQKPALSEGPHSPSSDAVSLEGLAALWSRR